MTTIKQKLEELIIQKKEMLKQAQLDEATAYNLLPPIVLELEAGWAAFGVYSHNTPRGYLHLSPPYNLSEPEQYQWARQTKLLLEKELGAVWEKDVSLRYGPQLAFTGKAQIGKFELSLVVETSKPPGCKLKATKTMVTPAPKEDINYEIECPPDLAAVEN